MGTVEDVLVATAAGYCCDLAAVEADAHVAEQLGFGGCGRFPYCATEVKACRATETEMTVIHLSSFRKKLPSYYPLLTSTGGPQTLFFLSPITL